MHFIGNKIQLDPSFSYDPRVRPFFLDAVKAQDVVWSPIHPYFGYPTLGIGLSTPIYSQQGKLLGVTATSLALIELDEYLASIDLVENVYAFIAEEDGALIATSQPDELYQITDGTTTRLTLATHANRVFGKVGQSFVPGAHSIEVDGESYLYQIRPITFGYDKTWIIGVIIPEAHHIELLDEYTYSMAWITLVLFIGIALVGSLVARYIGLPIQQLNVAANNSKLESIQNLPQPISRISEVNSLASGLQSMADDLSDVMHNLEQKVAQRTSDLQEENEGLLEQSHTDELTGLYNRRGFNQVFRQALECAQRHHKSVTFVLCDIDHFKRVNNNYGHNLGDRALAFVADNLKSHVRAEDIVARYGGEEFALVFVGAEQAQVLARLEKIRHSFAPNPVFGSYHITMSFGVSHLTSVSAVSDKTLINESDKKLYQAKSSGRDKIIS
ncbi:diguanylate cyclase [Vibrio sp. CAU 1672]|uniref:sensor domain-containing diguanylate cyclase n=1 Tax=Vibrio sp. CAU 1672 TaxID=3032594 RepID=UPI0023DAA9F7|nr:diguanylate cyclase [Vibrio sp. CAU 1672]MDF2153483.1 diguanylate cyclase [Vibrio sp. CAU 1672]